MLSFLSQLQQGLCPLAIVQPVVEDQIIVELSSGMIARGSLLRLEYREECIQKGLVGARVLSDVYFYQQKGSSSPSDSICIDESVVVAVDGWSFYSLIPPAGEQGYRVGEQFSSVSDTAQCQTKTISFEGQSIPLDELHWFQAIDKDRARQIEQLQKEWQDQFGDWALGRVWISDWNQVALPLEYYSKEDIEAEYKRENLESSVQREKAVIAKGPDDLWLHFLGTDALYSDIWGQPETIESLISIAQIWKERCESDPKVRKKESCTPQIGDIAWYNDRLPDPLGHRDHYKGSCIDLRLFRHDGSRYESYWNKEDDRSSFSKGYDLRLNNAFIDLLKEQGVNRILFSDPNSHAELASRHNDHIHFCFC